MIGRSSMLAGAVALTLVSPALAVERISGTVRAVDDTGRIIEFTDGRIVHLGDEIAVDGTAVVEDGATTAVLVDGRPVAVSRVRPWTYVVVPSDADAMVASERWSAAAPAAVVTEPTIEGTVVRVDPATRTIVLHDGRIVQTSSSTVVVMNDREVDVAVVQPGDVVVIRASDPVPSALPREVETLTAARVLIVRQPQAP